MRFQSTFSLSRKTRAVTLAFILFALGVFLWGLNKSDVQAAAVHMNTEISDSTYDDYIFNAYDGIDAQKYVGKEAPICEDESGNVVEGYLFAGWYTENTCRTPECAREHAVTKATKLQAGTTYYAKFVSKDVLDVKVQVSNVENANDPRNLRLVSSVEAAAYAQVGFQIKYESDGKWVYKKNSSNTVFKRIDSIVPGDAYSFSPKVVDTESEYFITSTWKGENNTGIQDFDKDYCVRAYWKTFDGLTIAGTFRYVSVNDGLSSSMVNVTVEDADDYFKDEYDKNVQLQVSYKDVDDTTCTTNATIAYHDGTYAYLRIDLGTSRAIKLHSATELTVKDDDSKQASTIYRNLYTSHTNVRSDEKTYGNHEDHTWYDVYNKNNEDEFVIASSADLYGFAELGRWNADTACVTFAGKTVYFCSDITINDGTSSEVKANSNAHKWYAISNFAGTVDGQDHVIGGLYAVCDVSNTANYYFAPGIGLFAHPTNATFRNFNVTNSYYVASRNNTGAVVAAGSGTLENIYTDVIIDAGTYGRTGGILGQALGEVKVTNCWSDSDINSSGPYYGGIVGNQNGYKTVVQHCLNTGNITYSETDTTKNAYVGGIVGRGDTATTAATLTIRDCLNLGTVKGKTVEKRIGAVLGTGNQYVTLSDTYTIDNYKLDGKTKFAVVGENITTTCVEKKVESLSNENLSGIGAYDNTSLTMGDGTPGAYWMVHRTSAPILAYFLEEAESVYSMNEVDENYFTIVDNVGYISNLGQLKSFQRRQNTGELNIAYPNGIKAILTANIEVNANADAAKWAAGSVALPASWEPIKNFRGTFEGNGHTISGISCTEDPYDEGTGLFTQVEGGHINNLKIKNSYFYATTNAGTGAVVGSGYGEFQYLYANVKFGDPSGTTEQRIGGIVGMVNGESVINHCWNASSYENFTAYMVGGILGGIHADVNTKAATIMVEHCQNTGNLISATTTSNAIVGGIVGMTGGGINAGGAGKLEVRDCLNAGIIDGTNTTKYMGAIAPNGMSDTAYKAHVIITDCHSIIRYDSTGAVRGKTDTLVSEYASSKYITINANSKAVELADVTDVHAVYNSALTFVRDGRTDGNWLVRKNGYPILYAFASEVAGERESFFELGADKTGTIENADELETFALVMNNGYITTDSDTYISMTADIDLNEGWTASATAPDNVWDPIVGFAGNFSGNGHTIRGIYTKTGTGNGIGLFTETSAASIQNFRIENSYYLVDSAKGAGAVVGQGSGIIKDVYADVIFKESGTDLGRTGGIVGIATGETMMNNCWSASDITTSFAYCGGILGSVNNTGYRITLLHCLNTGNLTTTRASGNAFLGGLVGRANTTTATAGVLEIRDSVNAGIVKGTKISDCMAGIVGDVADGSYKTISTTGMQVPSYLTIIRDSYTIKRYDSSGKEIATTSALMAGVNASSKLVNASTSKAIELADIKGNAAKTNTSLNFDSYWEVRTNDLPQLMHFQLAVGDYEMPRYETKGLISVHSLGVHEYELCVQNSSKAELLAYAALLEQQGYTLDRTNTISSGTVNQAKYGEDNTFYTYVSSERHMYLSWNPGRQTARVIMTDVEALPSLEIPKVTSSDNTVASIAQMQIDGQGMGYIIQLVDGSFICIDGGYYDYTQTAYPGDPYKSDRERMYAYMCEKSPDAKPQIMCWILTHGDPDHIGLVPFFLEDYAGKVDIHSFAYNFPEEDYKSASQDDAIIITNIEDLEAKINKYFPNAERYNVHAGQSYYFKGLEIQMLQTEEEFVPCKVATWNDSSLTMRMEFSGGQTAVFLTDNMQVLCQQLEETYTDYMKCDILQLAHHGLIGGDLELYRYAHPSVCYWSTSEARFNGTDPRYNLAYCKGQGGCDYNAYLHPDPDTTVLAKIGGGIGSTLTHYHNGHMGVVRLYSDGKIEALKRYTKSMGEIDEDPFTVVDNVGHISNLAQLKSFRRQQNCGYLDAYYPDGIKVILDTDIEVNANANAAAWSAGSVELPASWEPIKNFSGTFEGNGHTISGISCTEDPNNEGTGLFTMVDGATIQNLSIENSYFYASTSSGTGALVGRGTGTLKNIYSDVEFGAPDDTTGRKMGGIMGLATGEVELNTCWNASDYENFLGYEVGGILGGMAGSVNDNQNRVLIKHCLNTGNLISAKTSGTAWVGGIVGMCNASSAGGNGKLVLSDCLNAGIINGTVTGNMGAIVANGPSNSSYKANVSITNCYSAIRYDSSGTKIGMTDTLIGGSYTGNVTINNKSKAIPLDEISDVQATHSTALDFANGYWVVREADTPILAKFASKSAAKRMLQ